MRAVVQRTSRAEVRVDDQVVGRIDTLGLTVLLGVTHEDSEQTAHKLAEKIWTLRILPDEVSCADIDAPLLVVSQFTLYGDTRKGRRPSWSAAAPRPVSEPLVDELVAHLRHLGATVSTGRFGASMDVSLTNAGPFTVIVEV